MVYDRFPCIAKVVPVTAPKRQNQNEENIDNIREQKNYQYGL